MELEYLKLVFYRYSFFVKIPQPGRQRSDFFGFRVKLSLVTISLTTQR